MIVRALMEWSFHRIPADWTAEWKQPYRDGNYVNNPPEGQVQISRLGKQCQLLNLITASRPRNRRPQWPRTFQQPDRDGNYVNRWPGGRSCGSWLQSRSLPVRPAGSLNN